MSGSGRSVTAGSDAKRRPSRCRWWRQRLLFELEDLGSADDAAQRQTALGHGGLDRLDETLATHDAVSARKRLHRRLGRQADHALRQHTHMQTDSLHTVQTIANSYYNHYATDTSSIYRLPCCNVIRTKIKHFDTMHIIVYQIRGVHKKKQKWTDLNWEKTRDGVVAYTELLQLI